MTRESLMEMGLTEEQAKKVMEGLDGSFVPKSRFNEVNAELKTAKDTIKERDAQLETLQKSSGDLETLRSQISQLQTANTDQQKKHEEELKAFRMENAVDLALRQAKAINPLTIKPLLAAFLEKAAVSEDGSIPGLSDEIGKLVKGADTSFLFKTDGAAPPAVSGVSPAGSVTVTPDAKATGYESRLADARKAGNAALAVSIKREAAQDGIQLF